MKQTGILNHRLSMVVAEMGHTDGLTIADAGLPIPPDVERIDLAVSPGVPTFEQVLRAVATELRVEQIVIAAEAHERNPAVIATIRDVFPDIPIAEAPHDEFKQETRATRAVVRTGECSPYANCILRSGVIF